MPTYEQLYHLMVGAAEDAIAAMGAGKSAAAKGILIDAEQRAEELYISTPE